MKKNDGAVQDTHTHFRIDVTMMAKLLFLALALAPALAWSPAGESVTYMP